MLLAFCLASLARRASSSVLSKPAPLTHISALPLQRGVPHLQPLAVHAPSPPLLSILLQVICIHPLPHSGVRAYAPLIWKWEVTCGYRENALFCDTRRIDTIVVVILHKPT